MPAVLVSPASVAKRSGANQFDTSLSEAMKEKAAPAPMTRRARLGRPGAGGDGEERAAERRDADRRNQRAVRAEAIQGQADGDLQQRVGVEEERRDVPEFAGADAELALEIRATRPGTTCWR